MCTNHIKYIYTQKGAQVVFKTRVSEMDIYIDLGRLCMSMSPYIYICAHTLHGVYVQEIEKRVDRWWKSKKRTKRLRWNNIQKCEYMYFQKTQGSVWNEGIAWKYNAHTISYETWIFNMRVNMYIYINIHIYMIICTHSKYIQRKPEEKGGRIGKSGSLILRIRISGDDGEQGEG
jgi:hypothetical protein